MPKEEGLLYIGDMSPATIALLKQVSDESAQKAVDRTFEKMGLNTNDPFASQTLFVMLREVFDEKNEFREDLVFLRRTRRLTQGGVGKAIFTSIGVVMAGTIYTLWNGFLSMFGTIKTPPH